MKLFFALKPRPNRRSMLRDLHAFGIVRVFRQHSLFRLWEPLRQHRNGGEDFVG